MIGIIGIVALPTVSGLSLIVTRVATAALTFTGLIGRRLREIQTSGEPIGRRLFAEKPKRFVNRLGDYREVGRKSLSR
jgi:hypothetical protein